MKLTQVSITFLAALILSSSVTFLDSAAISSVTNSNHTVPLVRVARQILYTKRSPTCKPHQVLSNGKCRTTRALKHVKETPIQHQRLHQFE